MTLPTDNVNATVSLDTHPALHNDANAAINALTGRVTTLEAATSPAVTNAEFLHDGPMIVSTSGLSGWPGTRGSGYVPGIDGATGPWTEVSNDDAAVYGIVSSLPQIKVAGIFTVNIDYRYEVPGTTAPVLTLCEVEGTDPRTYFLHHPWPMPGWSTPTRSVIAGSHSGVIVNTTANKWSGNFRIGLYAPSNTTSETSLAQLTVKFCRLPVKYP